MIKKKEFFDYYTKYLGIEELSRKDKIDTIIPCNQRNKAISMNFFQYLIVTKIDGRLIYSIAPQYYEDFFNFMRNKTYEDINDILIADLDNYFSGKLEKYRIRKMYRLTIKDKAIYSYNNASVLTIKDKEVLMNSENNLYDHREVEIKAIEEDRFFAYTYNNKIVSYAKISDIYYDGGNIVVSTLPEFGKLGYGKKVVSKAIKWCIQKDVLPIYWVNSLNVPSINLAQSSGLEIMAEELVVSIEKNP